MPALNFYIKKYGYHKAVQLLRKKVMEEKDSNLKTFFYNCIDRIGSIDIHIIKKLDPSFISRV